MRSEKAALMEQIRTKKALSDDMIAELGKAINDFKKGFLA